MEVTDCVVAQLRSATIGLPVESFDGDRTSKGQVRHLLPRRLRFRSGARRSRHHGRLRRYQSQMLGDRLQTEFGIIGIPLDLISSYLSGRSFCVLVGSSSSSNVTMTTGVPQGSVLGPILFASCVAQSVDSLTTLASATTNTPTIHSTVVYSSTSVVSNSIESARNVLLRALTMALA